MTKHTRKHADIHGSLRPSSQGPGRTPHRTPHRRPWRAARRPSHSPPPSPRDRTMAAATYSARQSPSGRPFCHEPHDQSWKPCDHGFVGDVMCATCNGLGSRGRLVEKGWPDSPAPIPSPLRDPGKPPDGLVVEWRLAASLARCCGISAGKSNLRWTQAWKDLSVRLVPRCCARLMSAVFSIPPRTTNKTLSLRRQPWNIQGSSETWPER